MKDKLIGKKCKFDKYEYKLQMDVGEIVNTDHDGQRVLIMCGCEWKI